MTESDGRLTEPAARAPVTLLLVNRQGDLETISRDVFELTGWLEYHGYGLEYWAHLGGSRPRFTGIDQGPAEQLVVERAEPRELNPDSRVRTCPV